MLLILLLLCISLLLVNNVNANKLLYTARDFKKVGGKYLLKNAKGAFPKNAEFRAVYFNNMYYYVPPNVAGMGPDKWMVKGSLEKWFPYRSHYRTGDYYSSYWAYSSEPTKVVPRPASFDSMGAVQGGKINYYTSWTNAKKIIVNGWYYYVPSWYPETRAGTYPQANFRGVPKRLGQAPSGATNAPGVPLPKGLTTTQTDQVLDIVNANIDWRLYLPDSAFTLAPTQTFAPTTTEAPTTKGKCIKFDMPCAAYKRKKRKIQRANARKAMRLLKRRYDKLMKSKMAKIQKELQMPSRRGWTKEQRVAFRRAAMRAYRREARTSLPTFLLEKNIKLVQVLRQRVLRCTVHPQWAGTKECNDAQNGKFGKFRRLLEDDTILVDKIQYEIEYNHTGEDDTQFVEGISELYHMNDAQAIIEELNTDEVFVADEGEVNATEYGVVSTTEELYYEEVIPEDGEEVEIELRESGSVLIPNGILEIRFHIEGESLSSAESDWGYEVQGAIAVQGGDVIRFELGSQVDGCDTKAATMYHNSDLIAVKWCWI